MIIRHTIQSFIKASRILNLNEELVQDVEKTLLKFPPIKIGKNGTIQEWVEDYEEPEPGHRHMSQLSGLYPFTSITPSDTALPK